MTDKPRPRYLLTLQPTPDKTDPDGIRRLRRALKSLLRCFGLRCVRIEPDPNQQHQAPNPDQAKP